MTLHRQLVTAALAVLAAGAVAACGSASGSLAPRRSSSSDGEHAARAVGARKTVAASPIRPRDRAASVHLGLPVDRYPAALTARWQTITMLRRRPAVWIAVRRGVTLVRMDQRVVHLALHAGSVDPGETGWRYGDRVGGREIHHLILGVNGGFKVSTGSGGFLSFGRIGSPLRAGDGSIVTYGNGVTQIGAWDAGVPAPGVAIASVRQNLHLLIDHGVPASSVASCGAVCWGATIGNQSAVARSALGIRADGQLVWAAGEDLTVGGSPTGSSPPGCSERCSWTSIPIGWPATSTSITPPPR